MNERRLFREAGDPARLVDQRVVENQRRTHMHQYGTTMHTGQGRPKVRFWRRRCSGSLMAMRGRAKVTRAFFEPLPADETGQ